MGAQIVSDGGDPAGPHFFRKFGRPTTRAERGSQRPGKAADVTRFQGDAGHSEVDEAARGHGLRRVVGELIVCPHCLSMWFAALFVAALLVAPRTTRWIASTLAIVFASDVLQIAYRKAEDAL